ncbi:MAG TPA: tetratricopeptide repeat protein [bacterium]|nr:tetratricopeptide repeat protein [bacterium]
MSPEDPGSIIAEGEAKLTAGDLDGALQAFLRAVAAAPTSALAHSKVGIVHVHKKQWDDAAGAFTRAIQLDPTYAPAYSNLGNVYRERRQFDQAIAQYQKAITMDPDYWIAHQNLGVVYKQQGRVGEAVREFKIATRLSLRAPIAGRGGAGGMARGRRSGCLGSGGMMILATVAVATALRLS